MPAAVSFQEVGKTYSGPRGDLRALDHVSFDIEQGEFFGLLGPNGAGKTTTIRALVTLLPPQEGTVEVFGLDVRRRRMAVRRLIGYVPQALSADPASRRGRRTPIPNWSAVHRSVRRATRTSRGEPSRAMRATPRTTRGDRMCD